MNVLRLKETMLMNKVGFPEKPVFLLVRPKTYWVICYDGLVNFRFPVVQLQSL